ncbi:MAG: T9SS type A sorting domain-containing protein [Bacteroidia bacterium]
MNKLYITILGIILPAFLFSQQFDRSVVWGGAQADNASRILIDSNGDFICAGTYTGNSDFPSGQLLGYGFQDVFLTKTASDGSAIWQIGIGGNSTDQPSAIAIDGNNNIWLAGRFQSNIDINPGPTSTILTADPSSGLDGFIAKYNGTDGSLLQFYNISAGGIIDIRGIQISEAGDIFLAGQFAQTVDFDFGASAHQVTSNVNSGDGFVARYNSDMELQWVNTIGSFTPAIDYFSDIKLSPDGSLYVTGLLGGNADINPGSGQTILEAAIDAVLIRYSQLDGSLSWGLTLGGNSVELGVSLMVTEELDILLVGNLNSASMDVDPGPGSFLLSKTGTAAAPFIIRYSAEAEFLNALILGGSSTNSASINKVLPGFGNSILVLGSFSGSLDINPSLSTQELLVSQNGSDDAFIAQYSVNWELDRFLHITGEGDEVLNDGAISGIYLYGALQFNDSCKPSSSDTTTVPLKSAGFDAAILVWNMNPEVLTVEPSPERNIEIYPNPAGSFIQVSGVNSIGNLQAFDMQGIVVVLSNNSGQIDISSLTRGIYMLEITSAEGETFFKKLVKN